MLLTGEVGLDLVRFDTFFAAVVGWLRSIIRGSFARRVNVDFLHPPLSLPLYRLDSVSNISIVLAVPKLETFLAIHDLDWSRLLQRTVDLQSKICGVLRMSLPHDTVKAMVKGRRRKPTGPNEL